MLFTVPNIQGSYRDCIGYTGVQQKRKQLFRVQGVGFCPKLKVTE